MNGLENHPILKALIQTDDGSTQEVSVKKIMMATDDHAYVLVDAKGGVRPAQAEVREDRKVDILFFNAIWIADNDVWTLDIRTKEQKLRIGKLLHLG
ncbi:hypothetical protein [Pseudomonas syringae]|uniref:hypothetical protein n=1 Tax=Pseudomonas syringae TaxID=317 RepID=UPI000BB65F7F|nr:hypothetical protein [Pseudomonas syringae]PBQ11339.1 hypothetical protein CCL23_07585 [Pseudomonas syringae]